MANQFTCTKCGERFSVPAQTLEKFPRWRPRLCLRCRDAAGPARQGPGSASPRPPAAAVAAAAAAPPSTGDPALDSKLALVLARYTSGPRDGVFTDGGCSGNPGPGGWGAVLVREDSIVAQAHGREPMTTNNRMELSALIAGFKLLGEGDEATVWSDSELCVKTITEWAPGWERRGWRRKSGPIANLELVRELYALALARPKARLRWIKAHDGSRWNEYVDTLATGHLR
jgi:ribonuclease HI